MTGYSKTSFYRFMQDKFFFRNQINHIKLNWKRF